MEFTLSALSLPVRIRPERPMTDEELLRFCAANEVLRIEREPNGELTVMSPTGTGAAYKDSEVNFQLHAWARQTDTGIVFGASAGFRLPDGSMRSPDASLVSCLLVEVERPVRGAAGQGLCSSVPGVSD